MMVLTGPFPACLNRPTRWERGNTPPRTRVAHRRWPSGPGATRPGACSEADRSAPRRSGPAPHIEIGREPSINYRMPVSASSGRFPRHQLRPIASRSAMGSRQWKKSSKFPASQVSSALQRPADSRVVLRRIPAAVRASGDSEFRIRDSRFPDHSPSGIRNRESGIPMGLRPKAASESSSVGSLPHAASGDSGFGIPNSRIIPLRESGIANRESRWGCGRRPR